MVSAISLAISLAAKLAQLLVSVKFARLTLPSKTTFASPTVELITVLNVQEQLVQDA